MPGLTYVALGSSFAAAPGVPPLVHRGAMRSGRNYPHRVASALGLALRDATVSGATTSTLLREPQRTLTGTLAPQVEAVGPATDLVTVTAGGNDLGYIGSLTTAGLRGLAAPWAGPLRGRLTAEVPVPSRAQFDDVAAALAEVVAAVRARAPGARVVLVDYPTVLGEHATPESLPLTATQIAAGRRIADGLAAATARAAEAGGAELVRASAASTGHGVGAPEPWMTGVEIGVPWLGGAVPFHPNAAGTAAVADLVVTHLRARPE